MTKNFQRNWEKVTDNIHVPLSLSTNSNLIKNRQALVNYPVHSRFAKTTVRWQRLSSHPNVQHFPTGKTLLQRLSFVADMDECQAGKKNGCSPLQRCINTAGSYRCVNQTAAACQLGEQELDGRCIGG